VSQNGNYNAQMPRKAPQRLWKIEKRKFCMKGSVLCQSFVHTANSKQPLFHCAHDHLPAAIGLGHSAPKMAGIALSSIAIASVQHMPPAISHMCLLSHVLQTFVLTVLQRAQW
jgi:hypothetical protein